MDNRDEEQDAGEVHIFKPVTIFSIEAAIEEINKQPKYVVLVYLLCSIAGVFNAWHIVVSTFYAFEPTHWCKVEELETAKWSADQIRVVSSSNQDGSSCSMIGWNYTLFAELGYEKTKDFISNSSVHPKEIPCKRFFYDQSDPSSNVVIEWDLVCDRRSLKSHVQGSIASGKFIGAIIAGVVADRYGRKPIFLGCCLIYFVSGVSSSLTGLFWVYLITRFFSGIAGAGCYETGFTLLSELVSKKNRAALGCMYNLGYPFGFLTLPAISWMLPNWRHLQLAISLPLVIFIPHIWLLPESPRWYFVHSHVEKSCKTLNRFIKTPEQQFSDTTVGWSQQAKSSQVSEANTNGDRSPSTISLTDKLTKDIKDIFVLFSTCELCKRISISMFNFYVSSLVYYTIALNARNMELNHYLYTFVAGCVGFPGYILPLFIMLCMGRKWTSTMLFVVSGLTLVTIILFPKDNQYVILSLVMFGKLTNVAVFGLVTVYCAELFPTVVRNSAIGVSLAVSQLGSVFAPYIIDFLGPYGWYIPSTVGGVHSIAAGVLILLLPETKGKPFPNTLDDVKNQSEKVSIRNCCKFS